MLLSSNQLEEVIEMSKVYVSSREDILNITPMDVMSVYKGQAGKCCCGCKGLHRYNPAHRDQGGLDRGYAISDDEVNMSFVKKVLKVVQQNAAKADISNGTKGGFVTHVAVELDEKLYVVYLLPEVPKQPKPKAAPVYKMPESLAVLAQAQ